jgi:hypothetical protein
MSVDIKKFMEGLVPLDLILIQGVMPFSKLILNGSELIRGNGQFSHCGLVINKEVCPAIHAEDTAKLLLMEVTVSVMEKTKDIETGKFSLGSQIRDLEKVLEELLAEGAGVAVCHLKQNPYTIAKNKQDDFKITCIQMIMDEAYEAYFADNKSVYDLNIFSLLGIIFPSVRYLRDNIDELFAFVRKEHPWLFCSELICIIYKDLGMLEKDIDTQAYLPVDFVDTGKSNAVNSIMELPPVFLKQIHTPNTAEAKNNLRWISCCCNIL